MKIKWLVVLIITTIIMQAQDKNFTQRFLNQNPPGDTAELFAPGIVSNGLINRDLTMTPDGKEIYWTSGSRAFTTIIFSKYENGRWSEPEVFPAFANLGYSAVEPFITADGKRFYFVTKMPDGDKNNGYDIFYMERTKNGWGEPVRMGAPVNTEANEFFPTVTKDGTLYFNRRPQNSREEYIYESKLVNGKFVEPIKLPEQVNAGKARYNATISPEGDFIIVPVWGMPDTKGGTDYYISFKKENDKWTEPINMGSKINSESAKEWSASISPCGKYIFFMSGKIDENFNKNNFVFTWSEIQKITNSPENGNSDIYWVKSDFIKELKAKAFIEAGSK